MKYLISIRQNLSYVLFFILVLAFAHFCESYYFASKAGSSYTIIEGKNTRVDYDKLEWKFKTNDQLLQIYNKVNSNKNNFTELDVELDSFVAENKLGVIEEYYLKRSLYLLIFKTASVSSEDFLKMVSTYLRFSVHMGLPADARSEAVFNIGNICMKDLQNMDLYLSEIAKFSPYSAVLSTKETSFEKFLAFIEIGYSTSHDFNTGSLYAFLLSVKLESSNKNSIDAVMTKSALVLVLENIASQHRVNYEYFKESSLDHNPARFVRYAVTLVKAVKDGYYILSEDDPTLKQLYLELNSLIELQKFAQKSKVNIYLFNGYYFSLQKNNDKVRDNLILFEAHTNKENLNLKTFFENKKNYSDLNYFRQFYPDFLKKFEAQKATTTISTFKK